MLSHKQARVLARLATGARLTFTRPDLDGNPKEFGWHLDGEKIPVRAVKGLFDRDLIKWGDGTTVVLTASGARAAERVVDEAELAA